MYSTLRTLAYTTSLGLLAASAVARVPEARAATVPPFDGQYASSNASNLQTEWWYFQAIADPVGGNPPASVVVTFSQGAIFGTEPASVTGDPEYTISLSGTFANGTNFSYTIPATSGNVTTAGEAVTGTWGNTGTFHDTSDLHTVEILLESPEMGIQGTVLLIADFDHHYPCGDAPDPYFDSAAPSGVNLSASEQIIFHEYAWVVTIPGGHAVVALDIQGSLLQFEGYAYHDHDWMPTTINNFGKQWYWLWAQAGPYALTGALMEAANSSIALTTGYLAQDGEVLQNQCSLNASRVDDAVLILPYGAEKDAGTGALVPKGFVVEYTTEDGQEYSFNLTGATENPDNAVYYRWMGTVVGGQVGGEQYSGATVFEWMNPGLVPYSP